MGVGEGGELDSRGQDVLKRNVCQQVWTSRLDGLVMPAPRQIARITPIPPRAARPSAAIDSLTFSAPSHSLQTCHLERQMLSPNC